MVNKRIIAIDADGVLLDYHQAYRQVWKRAFGVLPDLADPDAYYPFDRWKVPRLDTNEREHLRVCQDETFWSTLPAMGGALSAAKRLSEAGFDLVCVSALPLEYQAARLRNLCDLGFPIERVIATPKSSDSDENRSIKADALAQIGPVAFVDDYAPYLRGVPPEMHLALIMREPNGSPNVGDDLALAHSTHRDLSGFAQWWLDQPRAD